jgi:hypothetical protein
MGRHVSYDNYNDIGHAIEDVESLLERGGFNRVEAGGP